MKYLFLSLFCVCHLFAGLDEEQKSSFVEKEKKEIVIVPIIQSIILSKDQKEISNSAPIDIDIPCDQEKLRSHLEKFLGQEFTAETLGEIRQSILQFFAESNNSLYLVDIPDQVAKNGRLNVIVRPACVDQIQVHGNQWFSSSSIERVVGVKSREEIREATLLNNVSWINRNPFIHADVVLSPGEMQGETSIEVIAKDRFPARIYGGTDNTGSSVTGNERFFVGTNISMGLYALLTYQFTSGYAFPEFQSHYANLSFFLPWKHEVNFYGGYAVIHPSIDQFDSKGTDAQGSMRYVIPFKPLYRPLQHQFLWGADYKRTDSSLFFLGGVPDVPFPVNQDTTDLFQFYLGYQLADAWNTSEITFKGEVLFSPFKFLPNQKRSDYNSLREGADVRYIYSRLAFGGIYHFRWDLSFAGLLRGQVASGALLPSEQFGLGGYDTVRGYQERIYLADNAVIGNFELRSPPISFFRSKIDELMFLIFVDSAYGYNWDPSDAFKRDEWLLGTGGGMRYVISPFLQARIDYGFRIHRTSFGNKQLGRVHFSVTAGY